MINPHEINNINKQEEQEDDIISNEISSISLNSNEQTSRLQYLLSWSPLNKLNLFHNSIDDEQLLDEIESKLFQNLNIKREFVYIRNNSLKIWTVSCNHNSSNTPIVLIHGYCGGFSIKIIYLCK